MQASCDTKKQPTYKSQEISAQRERMRRNYYVNGGKYKSLLKYYLRKFKDDAGALTILRNKEIDCSERLKLIQCYNYQRKCERQSCGGQ